MLSVTIACVGKCKEAYWVDACREYAKRLGAFCKFRVVEVPESRLPDAPSQAQIEAALREEAGKLRAAAAGVLLPLCVEGKELSSPELAELLSSYALRGQSAVTFLIGSSYGLDEKLKTEGTLRLSLSRLTLPHQLARVVLCEQVYRAFQISSHGKYHK